MNGLWFIILFVLFCSYGAGLIIYDKEKNNDTWFVNETIAVRYGSLCMVFIFIKIKGEENVCRRCNIFTRIGSNFINYNSYYKTLGELNESNND